MNLLEHAIDNNELLEFAIGKDKYFIIDKDRDEHNIPQSWMQNVIPLIKEKSEVFIEQHISEMIHSLVSTDKINDNEKNEKLLGHLIVYYKLKEEGTNKENIFQNVPDIEKCIEEYLKFLLIYNPERYKEFIFYITMIKSNGGLQGLNINIQ